MGKTHQQSKEISVQTGGFRGVFAKKKRVMTAILASIIMVGLLGLWGYSVMQSLNPVVEKADIDTERIPDDYLSMTSEQVAYVLEQRTGLNVSKLQKENFTKGTFKNDFDRAYQAAQALRGVENGQKSFEAYEIADSLVTNQDIAVLADFYLNYARVSLELGKNADVKRIATKAKSVIDESSLPNPEKVDEKEEFNDMIWLAEQ